MRARDRIYQTHLIGKNAVLMIPPVITEPVKTINLSVYQGATRQE